MKDPYRDAERQAVCPKCEEVFTWNKEDGLIGQQCTSCGHVFTLTKKKKPLKPLGLRQKLKTPKHLSEIRKWCRKNNRKELASNIDWALKHPLQHGQLFLFLRAAWECGREFQHKHPELPLNSAEVVM